MSAPFGFCVIRDQRRSNEYTLPNPISLDVQMRLVILDAERGIKSIPKLVETEKKELVKVWARCGDLRRAAHQMRKASAVTQA
jgi:hypothetical protein